MSEIKTHSILNLVGKRMTKTVKFLGSDVEIRKLSLAQVEQIQDKAKAAEASTDPEVKERSGFELLKTVVSLSVEGGSELSDEDFRNFPLEDLSKLSDDIMLFSGISKKTEGK